MILNLSETHLAFSSTKRWRRRNIWKKNASNLLRSRLETLFSGFWRNFFVFLGWFVFFVEKITTVIYHKESEKWLLENLKEGEILMRSSMNRKLSKKLTQEDWIKASFIVFCKGFEPFQLFSGFDRRNNRVKSAMA